MSLKGKLRLFRELFDYVDYKEDQYWNDSPYHDMKVSKAKGELKDIAVQLDMAIRSAKDSSCVTEQDLKNLKKVLDSYK